MNYFDHNTKRAAPQVHVRYPLHPAQDAVNVQRRIELALLAHKRLLDL